MQVFRELSICGEPEQLAATVEEIRQSLADGWRRDAAAEEHMRSVALGTQRNVYCFTCSKRLQRPAATLFLIEKSPSTLYITNVVPEEKHRLSCDEYNNIVEEFFERFAEPAAHRAGSKVQMTDSQADLETWLSQETAKKLRAFCAVANKRSGSSHPVDRKLWYDFIVSAHQDGTEFSASTLALWLVESGGWDEKLADRLAIEYEFARGLLAYGEKVGA